MIVSRTVAAITGLQSCRLCDRHSHAVIHSHLKFLTADRQYVYLHMTDEGPELREVDIPMAAWWTCPANPG